MSSFWGEGEWSADSQTRPKDPFSRPLPSEYLSNWGKLPELSLTVLDPFLMMSVPGVGAPRGGVYWKPFRGSVASGRSRR